MEDNPAYYPELITKYLAGEISEEESRVLTQWLESGQEHRDLFEGYRNTWLAVENSKIDSTVNVNEEWSKLKFKIQGGQADKREESEKSAVRSQKSGFQWALRVAAGFLLIAIPAFLLYVFLNNSGKKVISAQNQMVNAMLPDGTSVSLNSGSTIEFSENLRDSRREVKLKGEAYFTVKHDEKSKFVIVYGDVRIEDIGTSFYVNTNTLQGQMEVVLSEGKATVYFIDNPSGQVVITPGERADIRPAENNIIKSVNQDGNYLAWKTKRFFFSDNTLIEVVQMLNKVYHSDIRLSGNNINNCRLSATFDNQSLESVLNVIKSTLDVSIISDGTHIEISGNKCD